MLNVHCSDLSKPVGTDLTQRWTNEVKRQLTEASFSGRPQRHGPLGKPLMALQSKSLTLKMPSPKICQEQKQSCMCMAQ